jgi:hypothetical protein
MLDVLYFLTKYTIIKLCYQYTDVQLATRLNGHLLPSLIIGDMFILIIGDMFILSITVV